MTLKELFQIPRMFYVPLNPNNSVEGLFDLVKDCCTEETVMVEIGSFSGVSSELFAMYVKKIFCVDVWDMDKTYQEVDNDKLHQAELMFDKVLKRYNNIKAVKNYSTKVAESVLNESLDLVYIDGRHDYESVLADIKAWLPKIKKGGWITGHDIDLKFAEKEGKRVYEAVTKMFGNNYKTYSDTSWAVQVK